MLSRGQTQLVLLCLAALFLNGVTAATAQERSSGPALQTDTVLTSIAFGSCIDEEKPQPIWDAVLALKPQLFLAMGDNVYADFKDGKKIDLGPDMAELKEAYDRQAAHPDFSRALAAFPFWAVWDDHDFGKNDAGGEFPYKQKAAERFREFWRETGERGAAGAPGLYAAKIFGPPGQRLQIILLDTRNFRSRLLVQEGQRPAGVGPYLPDADPDKTMLGEAQWRWLEGELKKPADLRIVVSSVQVLTSGHRWERWSALQLEHERLLKLLKTVNEKAVILLSGDRHLAAMYRDAAPGPLLFEVTSSSMNLPLRRTPADQPDMRIGEPYTKENFGSLQIDWQGGTVSFKLHSLDGTAIQNETITFR